ncbi:MAG: ATPase, partial [Gemmiger sp.]
ARAAALLRSWGAKLDERMDPDQAFDAVRTGFNSQVRRREQAVAVAGDALEAAFDFMERAFPDGQEMVVFVNELALGPDSAAFLAENECERFETYSRRLLLHQGQDELLAELDRDELRRSEGSLDF